MAPGNDQRARVADLNARLMSDREVPRIFIGRKEGRKKEDRQEGQHAVSNAATGDALAAESPDALLDLVREGASLTVEQFLNDLRAQRLGKRRDPRIDLALPVVLTRTGVSGRPLDQNGMTGKINPPGAPLHGAHPTLEMG